MVDVTRKGGRPRLPRLEIKPYEGVKRPMSLHDLSVRLDGQEVTGLQGLSLNLSFEDANQATIELAVGAVEVDADVIEWLEANIDTEDKHG